MDALTPIAIMGPTQSLSVTATSGSLTFSTRSSQVRIWNAGTQTAFVKLGSGTVTASATADMPIPAGMAEVVSTNNMTKLAAICAAAQTTTLYVTPVFGL